MPNWCSNELHIYGELHRLRAFFYANCGIDDDGRGSPLLFESLVPLGEGQDPRVSWGTKSELDTSTGLTLNYHLNHIIYNFSTAWSPPIAWAEEVVALFPDLEFNLSYNELGNAFAGSLQGEDGHSVHEEHGMTPEEYHEHGFHDDDANQECSECNPDVPPTEENNEDTDE